MTQTFQIPYNRWLIGFLTFFWAAAAIVCAFYWKKEGGGWPFPVITLFLLVILYYLVRRLLWPAVQGEPALELTPEGLQDNIKGVRITWGNIEGFALIHVGRGSNYIRVDLTDNQEFLDQVKNPVRSWLYRLRQNMTGSPFVIPTTLLQGGDRSIVGALEAYKKEMHDHS
ncbi:STM3941 family protein [Dinghuibacter silviterrae]|uniref:PH (Pleckstrin Homology) domain-containing protein n=1 Tax=Dinghuibacter silviterrae TaxID=1539049 RepID=A0A4R8DHR1_9BACT|nr:STM3941 family protein [Dinghuibacter silviterrae]TDW96794.1 hypothetical protein EDB95_4630 [Dinghuibacter silviterrae]